MKRVALHVLVEESESRAREQLAARTTHRPFRAARGWFSPVAADFLDGVSPPEIIRRVGMRSGSGDSHGRAEASSKTLRRG